MNHLHALADRIRRGEPMPFPLACALSALTPLWRLGMAHRLRQPRVRVPAQVISFGNLTAGGTGKTPAVIERARIELAAGKKVAVLTRGYGAQQGNAPIAVPAAEASVEQLGDEPTLIARKAPGVLIVKGADRVAAARLAIETWGCDTLILDDGFQYVRLERDENIVLIDASNPFGNGSLIPRGILREPVAHIERATQIVLTRCDQAKDVEELLRVLRDLCPGIPVRRTCHAPSALWRVADGAVCPLDTLRGQTVKAVCGIGHPEAFLRSLESLGAHVAERVCYPDHAPIPAAAFAGPGLVVTTEKDAVRLDRASDNVLALGIELRDWA